MTLIFKARLLIQGRLLQTSSINKYLITSLSSKYIKQVEKPLAQLRFYSSEKNLPAESRERLYNGMLQKKIRLVKLFSLVTSAGSLLCQPYLISKALKTGSTVTAGGIFFTFGFFAFVTPVLLHMITKRYVLHVDYNPEKDTYIATTYSIFVQKKELEFRPEDVHLPNMSEMLTTCIIKGKPMFIDVQLFTDIDHYKRIMGFDKPMDFNLNTKDVESRKN